MQFPRRPKEEAALAGRGLGFAISLLNHLVVPTFAIDKDCRVIIWNRACEALTGVRAEEVLGTREHWRAFYDSPRPCLADLIAQNRTDEIESLYAHVSSENGYYAENWCLMPQVGTHLCLAIDSGPIYADNGELVAVVETLRDLTAHKEDSLTGLANRGAFDMALQREWRRAHRQGQNLSLLMIDVDCFKQYNDTYGHPQGDACLRQIASTLVSGSRRSGDLVARYGGEEFVLILPATAAEGAEVVGQRILGAVRNLEIPHSASQVMGHVTVSIGTATTAPQDGAAPDVLLNSADAALYRAKNQGRNCLVSTDLGHFLAA